VQRLPFVDTHIHFWDQKHPRLTYAWLHPDAVHPILGDIDGIKATRYEAEHWWAEARFAGVSSAVHVQAAVGAADPVEETRWLTQMHRRTGYPNGIVAHADLANADVKDVLDAHLESALMRGVRDFAIEPLLATGGIDEGLERGLEEMAARGLILDLDCEWPNMAAAADLARRHEDLLIVLDHIGYPRSTQPDYFQSWKQGISALAAAPNTVCKISGLGMNQQTWTVESIRPWVSHCIETFTPSRCVFGSNWPVDRLYSSYDAIIGAYRECIASFSPDEQAQLLSGNAMRVFRL
jgi:predicted TIM-barrel fold metal-dependent hydrolase